MKSRWSCRAPTPTINAAELKIHTHTQFPSLSLYIQACCVNLYPKHFLSQIHGCESHNYTWLQAAIIDPADRVESSRWRLYETGLYLRAYAIHAHPGLVWIPSTLRQKHMEDISRLEVIQESSDLTKYACGEWASALALQVCRALLLVVIGHLVSHHKTQIWFFFLFFKIKHM